MERSPYVVATVSEWRDREGWGVLVTDDVPEGIWAHFSALDGFGNLQPGERVEVDIEGPLPFDQDGYRYRARQVYRLY